ncbi:TcpQ domain-containing protein [Glaciecola sp. XM2]|uniref:TcpQ domain-containing protein n=1 Tax=Glaciecola sp. XM2 TaxID=1914931 RepID=UPI001BDDE184|nr:TcpQ domain-containing protein [Glaciecola sp. XM2]MBT1450627.1 TcpQ domain-containing protein [Glaciecola sp. XM2]
MGFWAKRILIIVFVVIGAFLVIKFMPEPALDENGMPIEKRSIETNMASFYEEFGMVSDKKIDEKFGENVILLPPPETSLDQQIIAATRPNPNPGRAFNWRGTYKVRSFSVDSTLKENTIAHVQAEGMDLVWHLSQDFIISGRFLSENTVVGMLNELAGAIDSNFLGAVKVYYCEGQRVMVITDQQDPALDRLCKRVRRF